MRLGFSMLFFGPRVLASHRGVLRELKAAGYDGVEVPTVAAEVAELRELGKVLDGEGLARSAVGFCGPEVDPTSPSAAVRQAAADHLRRLIDRASALGCDVLGGPMHSAYATFPARSDASVGANPQLLARSAEVLRGVAAHAQAAGVVLGLEYLNRFECCLVTTAAQTRALVDLVDHPSCGAVYDTHHAHIEDPGQAAAIRALGGRLRHVQLSESHRGPLGSGQVHWPEVFAALKGSGYDGWLVVEAFSRQDPAFGAGLRIWRELYAEPGELWRSAAEFVRGRWR